MKKNKDKHRFAKIIWIIVTIFLLSITVMSVFVVADFGNVAYEGLYSDSGGNLYNGIINVSMKYRANSCAGSILTENNISPLLFTFIEKTTFLE